MATLLAVLGAVTGCTFSFLLQLAKRVVATIAKSIFFMARCRWIYTTPQRKQVGVRKTIETAKHLSESCRF
jgi:hypothetical protein